MAEIIKKAVAGTLESSDVYVEAEPAEKLEISIDSAVEAQFGDAIRNSVREVAAALGVDGARLRVKDRGALDCVIRARVETALRRGMEA
ncbi:MAG TPA: citrate lyase acyl carrier protein [Bacillota bacterium]|nr:citrate lyase acyl carrier protein [Bacillota bacterium]HQC36196.1 citrate lyase acyl carrier protein [Bacillota bacterium]